MNMRLSADRARRVYDELTVNYGVPATALSAHGYGENYPNFPSGTEAQMVLDRRVLVVRVK
jgi:outer membrane protein OmpA-like peptidoglycan-associated protein